MAEITATLVNQLRGKTGLAMMKCKQLLTAAGGDLDKAFELARKEGLKDSIRERAANEGRVAASTNSSTASSSVTFNSWHTGRRQDAAPDRALARRPNRPAQRKAHSERKR